MCRFLMVKHDHPQRPQNLLTDFADMCRLSRTSDGDRQEDGWGIAYLDKNNQWQQYRSLKAIWEVQASFSNFPETKLWTTHDRSASFIDQKGNVEFNQPYIDQGYAFVFNGTVKGVKFNQPLEGQIGAQKIFSLLINLLEKRRTAQISTDKKRYLTVNHQI